MSDKSLPEQEDGVKRRGRIDVRFTAEDEDRIEEAVRRRNEREHGDLTPSGFVRMATRKFVAEELQGAA